VVPVIITAYEDKSFDFVIKTTPVAPLILKAAGLEKGSGNAKTIVGSITDAQLTEIAQYKLPDLNCEDLEAAKKIVAGSCRQMGIAIK
jgi:large subunit ribosomal protein L11